MTTLALEPTVTTAMGTDLETMWNTERRRLLNYMRRRVGPMQAEDLVQDLFLRAWTAICNGNGYTEHAKGYLFRSAHNAVIDFYRKRDTALDKEELDAPYFCDGDATLGELLPDDTMQPDELALQAETVREVRGAMDALPRDQRFVLDRRMAGYEIGELADETGKSDSVVKALQYRAYGGVRVQLSACLNAKQRTPPAPSSRVAGIREALLSEGPLEVARLVSLMGVPHRTMCRLLNDFDEIFVPVGKVKWQGGGRIWGLVGIHDTQQGAA